MVLAAYILSISQIKQSSTTCKNKIMSNMLLQLALLVLDKHKMPCGLVQDVMLHDSDPVSFKCLLYFICASLLRMAAWVRGVY